MLYQTQVIIDDGGLWQYRICVIFEEEKYVVVQIMLDDNGEPWNETPVAFYDTLARGIAAAEMLAQMGDLPEEYEDFELVYVANGSVAEVLVRELMEYEFVFCAHPVPDHKVVGAVISINETSVPKFVEWLSEVIDGIASTDLMAVKLWKPTGEGAA